LSLNKLDFYDARRAKFFAQLARKGDTTSAILWCLDILTFYVSISNKESFEWNSTL